ncbi:MAG: DoxX family protein [Ignavibacteriales bacterium]|nr:DoxX family protein [Ignavibacteriales bacterium]
MNYTVLVARILFSMVFIVNGLMGHFGSLDAMAGYADMKGVPLPQVAVVITGIMIVLGGLSILLGVYVRVGALLLVFFLVPTALIIHNFWTLEDEMARMNDMAHFMKDLALAGAAFLIWYFERKAGTFPLSVSLEKKVKSEM